MTGPTRPDADRGWQLFHGDGQPRQVTMPEPPPWRRFGLYDTDPPTHTAASDPYRPYLIDQPQIDVVNAALHLRRPLLVTGHPGTGKSSLAYAIAHEMSLGRVLRWPISSRSTLADALYQYDAVGRLRESTLSQNEGTPPSDIGHFIRLGPLGTALVPSDHPRVLLIDELDKGDVDLPNDLLTVFEEGEFEIPELARLPEGQDRTLVHTARRGAPVPVTGGLIRCRQFPIVVITSNGEREFPPAFLRRCLRLDLPDPSEQRLRAIVAAHLGDDALPRVDDLVRTFLARRAPGELATDQLLNAAYLRLSGVDLDAEGLLEAVLHQLGGAV
ncbi:AAA family ATPase [Streptomyces coffeae]|uniref:AAA family ATPase n=1 Tax=Streptomyces coffeae TaxID=621382 RepID=A0ABS1NNS4_9ACTN|nr:MoxR family ATPase [Streptomyces coffeae]MBL1101750.1 AAA family ATPase [Streptomyces coffeae]